MGNDDKRQLRRMKREIKGILTNKDVIAIDQDPLGRSASRVYADGEVEVWARPLAGGAMAIAVLEAGEGRYASHPFHLDLKKLGLHGPQTGKNLWTGETVTLTNGMPIELATHDVLLVRVPAPK